MNLPDNHPQKPDDMHPAVYAPVFELWKALKPGRYYDVASPENLQEILRLLNIRLVRTTIKVKDPEDKRLRTELPVLVACIEYDPDYEDVLEDLEREQMAEWDDSDPQDEWSSERQRATP